MHVNLLSITDTTPHMALKLITPSLVLKAYILLWVLAVFGKCYFVVCLITVTLGYYETHYYSAVLVEDSQLHLKELDGLWLIGHIDKYLPLVLFRRLFY